MHGYNVAVLDQFYVVCISASLIFGNIRRAAITRMMVTIDVYDISF